ncbi:MAG: ECF transporter S component [Clostridia bacterium]|nr:ECF transporter S component [Clostridia bacterium]
MQTNKSKRMSTERLVLASLMTALVVVFQCLATYTAFFGPFSTAIGLIPIVIGAVLCGPGIGAWLGLVFGGVVLVTGGANLFLPFSVFGTIITVLGKGMACGFAAGLVNKLLCKWNKSVASIAAALTGPIVNTGVFLLGCWIFFMPHVSAIAEAAKSDKTGFGVFIAMAMVNFLIEIGMNVVLTPVFHTVYRVAGKKR